MGHLDSTAVLGPYLDSRRRHPLRERGPQPGQLVEFTRLQVLRGDFGAKLAQRLELRVVGLELAVAVQVDPFESKL
jgi:hypothetical protein